MAFAKLIPRDMRGAAKFRERVNRQESQEVMREALVKFRREADET